MREFAHICQYIFSKDGHDGTPYLDTLGLDEILPVLKAAGYAVVPQWKLLYFMNDYYKQHGLAPSWPAVQEWLLKHPYQQGAPAHFFNEKHDWEGLHAAMLMVGPPPVLLPQDMPALAQSYIEAIQREAVLRMPTQILEDMRNGDFDSALKSGVRSLQDLLPPDSGITYRTHDEPVEVPRGIYEGNKQRRIAIKPFFTGMPQIDDIVHGFDASELVAILGSTGHGKSTLAMNWAYNSLIRGLDGAYLSLEMSANACMNRFYSIHSGHPKFVEIHPVVPAWALNKGQLTAEQESFIYGYVIPDFMALPGKLHVLDSTWAFDLDALGRELAKAEKVSQLSWFCVDHPDIMTKPSQRNLSTYQNTALLYQELRKICSSFQGRGIVGIIPIQSNREGFKQATTNDGIYTTNAISGSAEVERSCTQIYYLWADEICKSGQMSLIGCLKNRDGFMPERFRVSVNPITGAMGPYIETKKEPPFDSLGFMGFKL